MLTRVDAAFAGPDARSQHTAVSTSLRRSSGFGSLKGFGRIDRTSREARSPLPNVTIQDAIKYLCLDVAMKHQQSVKVGKYPADEINDDNTVSATPIDKVNEHGFYPLTGGFRAVVSENFESVINA